MVNYATYVAVGNTINHWSYSTYNIMGVDLTGHALKHMDAFQSSMTDLNCEKFICHSFLWIFWGSIKGK